MTLQLLSQILLGIILFIAVFNSAWVAYLVMIMRRPGQLPEPETLGKAVVFLCLRGADPRLASCLDRLMSQDHPNYEVMVVVDSVDDPAWPIVQAAIQQDGNDRLRAWPLKERRKTCGLKNSSLVQLLDQIDGSHDAIAFADADLESHPTWLRELVAPLTDPSVGLAFGNRWFLPSKLNTGGLVRQVWNAPGLIVMSALKIPWAGSLAIKGSLIELGGVRERLATSIVDDGPLRIAAKQQGLRTVFVPSLIMANRENCDLPFAYTFIRRQLTWTRTYFPRLWLPLLGYHLFATFSSAAAQVLVLVGWVRGDRVSIAFGLTAFVLSLVAVVLQYLVIDQSARRVIQTQGGSAPAPDLWQLFRLPTSLSLAAIIGLIASFVATFARRIVWRGVTYEIQGPWKIRLIDDKPFAHVGPRDEEPPSIKTATDTATNSATNISL